MKEYDIAELQAVVFFGGYVIILLMAVAWVVKEIINGDKNE